MKKLIGFEGLFSYLAGYVRNGLLKPSGLLYASFSRHGNPGPQATPVIVIGHSFGAWSALQYAKKNPQSVAALILIDPRMPPWGGGGMEVEGQPFKTHAFYQTGFMRGYPVDWAVNYQVSGFSHTQMPRYPKIMELVRQLAK